MAYGHGAGPCIVAGMTESLEAPATGPGEWASRDGAKLIVSMLRGLPPLERAALDLAHTGRLAVGEIAVALGEDPADIRRALRVALLQIGRAVAADR